MFKDKTISIQLKTLPEKPGVYQFYNEKSEILYIGKAKNLKKRVKSYFTKNHDNNRTRLLVKKIFSVKHIIVETETDALLLENSLMANLALSCVLPAANLVQQEVCSSDLL